MSNDVRGPRLAQVLVAPPVLEKLLRGMPRPYRTNLPADATLTGVSYDRNTGIIRLVMCSATFAAVPNGEEPPIFEVMLTEKDAAEARVRELEGIIDDACAVTRLPDTTNDGGPGDLAEEIRSLVHNWNEAEDRVSRYYAELATCRAENARLREALQTISAESASEDRGWFLFKRFIAIASDALFVTAPRGQDG